MNKKGFTLIELLIVVAIIGIIAAIAIPNLLVALQKGKQKATMGDLKSIGTGIESYITDWAVAPETSPMIDGLATADGWFEPFYIKIAPKADGWGKPWGYESRGTADDEYSIYSAGRDGSGVPAGITDPPLRQYICTTLSDFNWDIVFSNGSYTVGPDVKR